MKKQFNSVVLARVFAVLCCVLIAWNRPAKAGLFAFTGFEEPAVFPGDYTDLGDPALNHALVNNVDEPLVNWIKTGLELGFTSSYSNTRDGVGLTDGDLVGVTDSFFAAGTKSFQMSDTDGLMTTALDAVSLSGYLNPILSLDYYVAATGWESDDRIRIWATVDGGAEIDLLNTAGHDIDDLGIEGAWMSLMTDLTGYTTATLAFELDSNAGGEVFNVDNVEFDGIVVPIPSSLVLAGLGLGLAGWLRRRCAFLK